MRLTERKVAYPHCDKQGNITQVNYIEIKDKKLAEEKLCQLEDIEDELGIDLITLFKALKNGIYVKTKYGISRHHTIHLMKWLQTDTYCLYYRPYSHIWFKDYCKTWALTMEELL